MLLLLYVMPFHASRRHLLWATSVAWIRAVGPCDAMFSITRLFQVSHADMSLLKFSARIVMVPGNFFSFSLPPLITAPRFSGSRDKIVLHHVT